MTRAQLTDLFFEMEAVLNKFNMSVEGAHVSGRDDNPDDYKVKSFMVSHVSDERLAERKRTNPTNLLIITETRLTDYLNQLQVERNAE